MTSYGVSSGDDRGMVGSTLAPRLGAIGAVRVCLGSRSARAVASVVGCCLLMTLGARVRVAIPWTDVPMTLQLLAVLLIGFSLEPALALGGMLTYLACGTAGLPVFTAGSLGLPGPTGGYLVGFVLAAWVVSNLRGGRAAGVGRLLLAGVTGVASVLVPGVLWHAAFVGGDVWLSVDMALVPFVPKAVVELLLAVTLVTSAHRTRRRGWCSGE